MNRVLQTMLLVGVLLASGPAALAQTTSGTILGEVRDATGARLPGVTLVLTNQSNGATREVVTDELGSFSAPGLPPGTYSIKATLSGFRELTRTDVRLPINSQVEIPLTLEVGGLAESVTVTNRPRSWIRPNRPCARSSKPGRSPSCR